MFIIRWLQSAFTYVMATKQEREDLKAKKLADAKAKADAKAAAQAAKDQAKADKKAAKEAEKAQKKTGAAPTVKAELAELKGHVEFENATVVSILHDGRENATHFHCKMSDGTTKHVPKALFIAAE